MWKKLIDRCVLNFKFFKQYIIIMEISVQGVEGGGGGWGVRSEEWRNGRRVVGEKSMEINVGG